jgi:hypothetical protein
MGMAARKARDADGDPREDRNAKDMTKEFDPKASVSAGRVNRRRRAYSGEPIVDDLTVTEGEDGIPSDRAELHVPGFLAMAVPVDVRSRPVLAALFVAVVLILVFTVVAIAMAVADVLSANHAAAVFFSGALLAALVFVLMWRRSR